GSSEVDMRQVAVLMAKRGWVCGPTTAPPGIHVMCTPVHEPIAGEYVAAIAECIAEARSAGSASPAGAKYNLLAGAESRREAGLSAPNVSVTPHLAPVAS